MSARNLSSGQQGEKHACLQKTCSGFTSGPPSEGSSQIMQACKIMFSHCAYNSWAQMMNCM